MYEVDETYVSVSSKYKSYLNKILPVSRNAVPTFTFLSGAAGIGKSTILAEEFANPLKKYSKICWYRFSPGKHLSNNYFAKSVIESLLEIPGNLDDHRLETALTVSGFGNDLIPAIKELWRHAGLSDQKIVSLSLNEDIETIIAVITKLAVENSISLFFDDIHCANQNFRNFLDKLSTKNFYHPVRVFCATRFSKDDHHFFSGSDQKWFYVEKIDRDNCFKIGQSFASDIPESVTRKHVEISDGNPYLLKQSLLNLMEGRSLSSGRSSFYGGNITDGGAFYLTLQDRVSVLSEKQREILGAASVLGSDFSLDHLVNISDEHDFLSSFSHLHKIGLIVRSPHLGSSSYSFHHHIFYQFVADRLSQEERAKHSLKAFRFLRHMPESKNFYDRIGLYAEQAGLDAYAYYYYHELAKSLYSQGDYDLAARFYRKSINIFNKIIPIKSDDRRIVSLYSEYLNALLISGQYIEAKEVISVFKKISEKFDDKVKAEALVKTTVIYWMFGDLESALIYGEQCFSLALEKGDFSAYVRSGDRISLLLSEMGEFSQALEVENDALRILREKNVQETGSYSMIKPAILANLSRIHYELGNYEDCQKYLGLSYEREEDFDTFTHFYLATVAGYTLYSLGQYEALKRRLDKCLDLSDPGKIVIVAPVFLSLYGACLSHSGEPAKGEFYLQEGQRLKAQLHQGHKTGLMSFLYLENRLLQFKTENFVKLINQEIKISEATNQRGSAGWLYFLKAVYFSFYKKSKVGFLGAIAKANMYASELKMVSLQNNIDFMLDSSSDQLFNSENFEMNRYKSAPPLKAQCFYNLTKNIQSIHANN